MESIYKTLKILEKYKINESDDINRYINYANQVNKSTPKYELDDMDVEIIKCIINPSSKFNITKYGDTNLKRTKQGVKVNEILFNLKTELQDECDRIYGLIISGYIEPLIPITSEFCNVSDAITKIGIEPNTEDYVNSVLILYKCTWLVEKFGEVDLSVSQEGYELYIRILFNKLDSYEKTVNKIVEKAEKRNNEFTEKIKESEKKLETIQKSLKESTTQSITILSIFAAVVMAFTGGMSYISQALVSLNSIGPYRAGIFILLIGVMMFNLIFLLLYMIGKLTDRYIGSSMCKCQDSKIVCKHKKIYCIIKRYPYVICFNLISLFILITIIILCFLDRYDLLVRRFIDITTAFSWYKLAQDVGIAICIFIIYYIFACIIKKLLKILKINCNNDESGS